ncbi:MAG: PDC sensor domain-containing protein [Sulfuricaulis sp.]
MTWLKEAIKAQRAILAARLESPMSGLAVQCAQSWRERDRLDETLRTALADMPVCRLLYAIDTNGRQVSSNVGRHAIERGKYGQNLAHRPYLSNAIPYKGFLLSDVYLNTPPDRRSCITGVQAVADGSSMLGFVAADFYLRDLPQLEWRTESAAGWRQIKGDPAIRHSLFQQERAKSAMDERLDDVIAIMDELICERGVFHGKLHFSSSRATLWLTDDPFRYRVHVLEEIIDPSICLAYRSQPYSTQTVVPPDLVRPVFEQFKRLRNADENIYLRSGSLNVINGMVGLTFSCDGSYYMPVHEFLDKNDGFWFGEPQT